MRSNHDFSEIQRQRGYPLFADKLNSVRGGNKPQKTCVIFTDFRPSL